jgi:hypothetical protein
MRPEFVASRPSEAWRGRQVRLVVPRGSRFVGKALRPAIGDVEALDGVGGEKVLPGLPTGVEARDPDPGVRDGPLFEVAGRDVFIPGDLIVGRQFDAAEDLVEQQDVLDLLALRHAVRGRAEIKRLPRGPQQQLHPRYRASIAIAGPAPPRS